MNLVREYLFVCGSEEASILIHNPKSVRFWDFNASLSIQILNTFHAVVCLTQIYFGRIFHSITNIRLYFDDDHSNTCNNMFGANNVRFWLKYGLIKCIFGDFVNQSNRHCQFRQTQSLAKRTSSLFIAYVNYVGGWLNNVAASTILPKHILFAIIVLYKFSDGIAMNCRSNTQFSKCQSQMKQKNVCVWIVRHFIHNIIYFFFSFFYWNQLNALMSVFHNAK